MQKSVEEDFKAAEREAHRKIGQGNAWLALLIVLTVLLFVFLGATRAEWSALAGIVGAYLLTGLFENFIVPILFFSYILSLSVMGTVYTQIALFSIVYEKNSVL